MVIIISILQVRRLSHREALKLALYHTASQWQRQNSNLPGLEVPAVNRYSDTSPHVVLRGAF